MFDDAILPAGGANDGYPADMTVHASEVAAEIRRRLPGIGIKKLHKLLYYCQGHHLLAFEAPIFSESVSARVMGPVVGRLWLTEKAAGESVDATGALDDGSNSKTRSSAFAGP
ncbi:MAG TPA: type II toxin-antitoxin system antitoxin SocA domain-containing protein [Microlunatus sp.]